MNDILRIMYEKDTFTQDDLASALEVTPQAVSKIFGRLQEAQMIERVRVGHYWLYALTARARKLVEKLTPMDLDERLLPLTFEGVTPCDCFHNQPPNVISRIAGMVNGGATQIVQDDVYCSTCGEWWSSDRRTNTPL